VSVWEGLSPPYSTIVADPPWHYTQGGPTTDPRWAGSKVADPPYSMMSVEEIAALPVADLAVDAHLYLWTTNKYLRDSFDIVRGWGFRHSQTLTWCKPPRGIGPGGASSNTTEFVLYCRRGSLPYRGRIDTTWWQWQRGPHSVKPPAFLDIVEQVSPGPYVELFARAPRLGWDSWGKGYESEVA
jgi:N6-adenosine-specific RNA methylase IME4